MAADQNALASYLTDHMAGSVTASDLTERGASANAGQVAEFYAALGREIDEDRATLREIAEQVGVTPSAVKEAAAKAGERLSRFKMDHRVTANPALSLLLELELLYLGIQGKNALWRTLRTVADHEPRLSGFDFDQLGQRAEAQLDRVDRQRLAAAAQAFRAD